MIVSKTDKGMKEIEGNQNIYDRSNFLNNWRNDAFVSTYYWENWLLVLKSNYLCYNDKNYTYKINPRWIKYLNEKITRIMAG